MKSLYKKIGLGVLAVAVVAGASLSQGVMVHAQEKLAHKCQYSISERLEVGEKFKKELERKEFEELKSFQGEYNYEVGAYLVDGASSSGLSVRYAGPKYMMSCLNEHRDQLKGLVGKFHPFAVGANSYMIKLK